MTKELLGLHNLESNSKARKTKIRRGRGNSSGRGNYSGRGMKGQKSRSGGKGGLKVRGLRSYLLRIPKSKGFKSKRAIFIPINLDLLEKYYIEGELVSLKSLAKKELIPLGEKNVKILGTGKLTKKLRIKIDALSGSAKKAIIDLGGEILTSKKKIASVKAEKNEKKESIETSSKVK
ncbi:MAG: 50S ribosomal protein L15 [Candidatus Komeilibacteria bacterium]